MDAFRLAEDYKPVPRIIPPLHDHEDTKNLMGSHCSDILIGFHRHPKAKLLIDPTYGDIKLLAVKLPKLHSLRGVLRARSKMLSESEIYQEY